MLEAQADEVGLIVQHISDRGFFLSALIGEVDRARARARRVQVPGNRGPADGGQALHEAQAVAVEELSHEQVHAG
ncbi:MAG: hypothetical protein Q9M35_08160 [Rhodothermus sp.]|nr:hypothetical protein [Rhodothermus sp.]